jgi:putative PIN family toxin of toxin-antitoxin system
MRITLDTNVLVSAFISKQGHPAAVLDLALTFNEIELALSEPVLDEFGYVLSRPDVKERFDYSSQDIAEFAGAHDGKSDYIVSGDHHLQKVRRFKGIRILSPKSMMNTIQRKFGEMIVEEL